MTPRIRRHVKSKNRVPRFGEGGRGAARGGFKVTMGNVLVPSPPLVIAEGEWMQGLDILEGCIGEVG